MKVDSQLQLLLFGASGAIGSAIASEFLQKSWNVTGVARNPDAGKNDRLRWLRYDPFTSDGVGAAALDGGPYDAVCWAQGANSNDNVRTVDVARHLELYRANALYNAASLKHLLERSLLKSPARLCVISSIWQTIARSNKLSYCMSKAALQGFVLGAAADLASEGHLINAVLPGALDTEMTRRNLKHDQIRAIEQATPFNRLPTLEDVAGLVYFLCSDLNRGITGQFIGADLGFRHVRVL